MTDKIIITKYSSRRLYNTQTSEYVTLDHIAEFIRDGKEVQIIDKETNEDVTNQYLLQIISDYEIKKGASIPKDILTEIIKSYSDASKNFMPEILSQTFNFMKENQEKFLKSFNSNFDVNSNNEKSTETLKNWQDFQSQMMSNIMYPWYDNSNTEDSSETKKSEKAPKEEPKQQNYKSDIDLMKEQIAALQKQLNEKNKE
ncbi:polyhydroxyalkanoate synthesis repressor PhaR [Alphaproteobacteria bacterium]|nr:polyhydroxyalkanoate synthesis repressor PhaR [Alphaproteobacteria bacterium]